MSNINAFYSMKTRPTTIKCIPAEKICVWKYKEEETKDRQLYEWTKQTGLQLESCNTISSTWDQIQQLCYNHTVLGCFTTDGVGYSFPASPLFFLQPAISSPRRSEHDKQTHARKGLSAGVYFVLYSRIHNFDQAVNINNYTLAPGTLGSTIQPSKQAG